MGDRNEIGYVILVHFPILLKSLVERSVQPIAAYTPKAHVIPPVLATALHEVKEALQAIYLNGSYARGDYDDDRMSTCW